MKRRNAETGKMRRPVKRTKITEGMYGSSMVYLKFVLLWAAVVMADYFMEFRFEFLWPFWMMIRSVYDSFKYQGIVFSVFFICIALTSDVICFFFIPLHYIFFAASTYVWVQYVWYTFADKGVCIPTAALCCALVYIETALRAERPPALCGPLAAHCVGYPAATLGIGVRTYVGQRLRLRRQRQVRAEDEFILQLLRASLASSSTCSAPHSPHTPHATDTDLRKRRVEHNGNGVCHDGHVTHNKIDKVEKQNNKSHGPALTNGGVHGAGADEHEHTKVTGSAKSSKSDKKEAITLKEEKRKQKHKDKDSDSHKSTEQIKEQSSQVKDVESTNNINISNNVKNHKDSSSKEKDKDRDKEKEREREMREKEKEKEREREREKEIRWLTEELKRVRSEVSSARAAEAAARRALHDALTAERTRTHHHHQLRQQHAALQHKVSTWRAAERERRSPAPTTATVATCTPHNGSGECWSGRCRTARASAEAEAAALRREIRTLRAHHDQLGGDLQRTTAQLRSLEAGSRQSALERALSAETRVKLDLLSALGDAKRRMHRQDGVISKQEKEIEELKVQMLAVMPPEYVTSRPPAVTSLRMTSPLDPNASVYTPRQLCSDA